MPPLDELAIDVAAETANFSQKAEVAPEPVEPASETTFEADLDTDIEVPESSFWDEGGDTKPVASDESQVADSDVSSHDGGKTITYKANGKDVTISIDEAVKHLSLVDGARKAFSDRARYKKQYDALNKEISEVRKYKETFDKLESIKHDPEQMYHILTGESFNEAMEREFERRQLYSQATAEERRLLDQESEMEAMRREIEQARQERDRDRKQVETEKFEVEKTQLQGKLEREFFKHEIPSADASVAARLKKMLWRNAVADLKDFNERGYKINEKAITKAFRDNAAALRTLYSKEVDRQVKQTTDRKKQDAKEKAQIASTRNYGSSVDKELSSLDPLSLFQRLTKGK